MEWMKLRKVPTQQTDLGWLRISHTTQISHLIHRCSTREFGHRHHSHIDSQKRHRLPSENGSLYKSKSKPNHIITAGHMGGSFSIQLWGMGRLDDIFIDTSQVYLLMMDAENKEFRTENWSCEREAAKGNDRRLGAPLISNQTRRSPIKKNRTKFN